jgi:peptide chain release factor 1
MAKEHDRLTEETAETFDAKNVTTALKEYEDSEAALEELHALLRDPTTDDELRELATEDIAATQSQLDAVSQSLSTSLVPRHPFADMACLMEIRPGAGGGEAAIFAGDLLRMYRAFCARRGYKVSLMKYDTTDGESGDNGEAPLAEAVLEIEASGAYGELRSEAGVHRVQRVPATEKAGRTHTSAVSVLVLPSLPATGSGEAEVSQADVNDPESDYYINAADVRTDVYRSRGAGGQHVNTTDSAVRLTHVPTNTVVSMQDSRSQHKNREKAWQLLRSKIAQSKREAREAEVASIRRGVIGVASMGRENKIRTYNWGQQRVSDHRSGINVHNLGDVMDGGTELDKVIDSVKAWMGEQEMQTLLAEEEARKPPPPAAKKK